MYNDFRLIDEEKINSLLTEYNSKIKVNINNIDGEFLGNLEHLLQTLTNSKHNIDNLIALSKNSSFLEKLNNFKAKITEIYEKLVNLYDVLEVESENGDKVDKNFEENYKNIINNLLSVLKKVFEFISFESNIKIKNSLNIIFYEVLEMLEDLNNLSFNKPKIFSLFKKY